MKGSRSDLAALVGTGLRGLRSRLLLTAGSVLLAAIAMAAAVVGPMYQSASAASFLVSNLRAQPYFVTGVTFDYRPPARVNSTRAQEEALQAVGPAMRRHFQDPELSVWSLRLPVLTHRFAVQAAEATLLAEPGICRRLVVTGRCPSRVGEMLMLASDAAYTDTSTGDRVEIASLPRPVTVVGTYRLRTSDSEWFDPTRFTSIPPQPSRAGRTPYVPGPFVVTESTVTELAPVRTPRLPTGGPASWYVRMDYRLQIPASLTLADLEQAAQQVARLPTLVGSTETGGSLSLELGNALKSVVREVEARRVTAEQTVTPAVVSLILVALVLLVRLLSSAMELRRPELALASLRGIGRPQLWVLAMLEPVLMLAMATPVGIGLGYLAGRVLAAEWLVPGLPVVFGLASLWFAIGVLGASLVAAVLAVRSATTEPLSAQIASVRRPAKSSRWGVLARLALVAGAAAVLAATLWSGKRSEPTATDLLLPILLAVAAGVLMSLAAARAARWWAARSVRRQGVAGYVAARTIARRREGTWVILPLTAALAISVFAGGIYSAAANWRASDAATRVGAEMAFPVNLPLAQAVALTTSSTRADSG